MRSNRFFSSLRFKITAGITIPLLVILGAFILFTLVLLSVSVLATLTLLPGAPFPPLIDGYHLKIDGSTTASGAFTITEAVDINQEWVARSAKTDIPPAVELPPRQVTSANAGFLAKEVRIDPLQADASGDVSITLPDGRILTGRLCSSCESTAIELQDVPQGSFLAARDADNVEKHPYVGTETVTWSVLDLREGIRFAYVPPPYQYLRPLLQPLIGASTLNQWVLGLAGLIGTLVVSPIVKPMLLTALQKKIEEWLAKLFGKKDKKDDPSKKQPKK